jgi:hypothetical protein
VVLVVVAIVVDVAAAMADAMEVVVAVLITTLPSKGAHARSPARSAPRLDMKLVTVGTAMMMMMSTSTRPQVLLLQDMGLTPTGMQTVVHPITSPAILRR